MEEEFLVLSGDLLGRYVMLDGESVMRDVGLLARWCTDLLMTSGTMEERNVGTKPVCVALGVEGVRLIPWF